MGGASFKEVWSRRVEEPGPRHPGGSALGGSRSNSVAEEDRAREQGQGPGSATGCVTQDLAGFSEQVAVLQGLRDELRIGPRYVSGIMQGPDNTRMKETQLLP